MDQELLQDNCQAYLLGALEGAERDQLELLIGERDPDTLAALGQARELVARIAFAAPAVEPPAGLRARAMAAAVSSQDKVVPIARPKPRPNFHAWAAWAVAAGLLLFAVSIRSDSLRLEQEIARLRGEAATYRRVLAVLGARDSRTIRLASTASQEPQFRAYWSAPAGLVLVGSSVVSPRPGRTLQLWVLPKDGSSPVSAGVFQPDDRGQVVMIAETVAAPGTAAGLAISDEPAGGSPQPTTTPAWLGKLSD